MLQVASSVYFSNKDKEGVYTLHDSSDTLDRGALLSRLVKGPLQMRSIVIGGSIYDGGFVQQALFGRALAPSGTAPEFCHTSLVFHSSREAAEADEASSKVSTPGLSLVWNAEQRSGASISSRSKSEKITGFYDVLIGHTGQRQGLRNDRQAKKLHSEPDSWVSPLCKKLVVQDLLTCLRRMLGGDEALAEWLKCSNSERRKRPRVEPAFHLENKEKPANDRRVSVQFPSYAWLKEMLTSEDYGAARKIFHSGEPFCHWWRKQTIQFENDECGVDGFKVDLLSDIFTSNSTEFAIPLCRLAESGMMLPDCVCPSSRAEPGNRDTTWRHLGKDPRQAASRASCIRSLS
eukprot:s2087_g13.t2